MCTAITLQDAQGEWFMGRTMDFSYLLDPYLYAVPKGLPMAERHRFGAAAKPLSADGHRPEDAAADFCRRRK